MSANPLCPWCRTPWSVNLAGAETHYYCGPCRLRIRINSTDLETRAEQMAQEMRAEGAILDLLADDDCLSPTSFARIAGCSVSRVEAWRNTGKIEAVTYGRYRILDLCRCYLAGRQSADDDRRP